MQYPAFTEAYRKYLDRMIEQSEDLCVVDQFTVPQDVDINSPTVQEWATFEWPTASRHLTVALVFIVLMDMFTYSVTIYAY